MSESKWSVQEGEGGKGLLFIWESLFGIFPTPSEAGFVKDRMDLLESLRVRLEEGREAARRVTDYPDDWAGIWGTVMVDGPSWDFLQTFAQGETENV